MSLEGPKWEHAMKEIDSIKENDTFELTNLSVGQKTAGVKWVYTIKENADRKNLKIKIINRFKDNMQSKFNMKDLQKISSFLGIQFDLKEEEIKMIQTTYI